MATLVRMFWEETFVIENDIVGKVQCPVTSEDLNKKHLAEVANHDLSHSRKSYILIWDSTKREYPACPLRSPVC